MRYLDIVAVAQQSGVPASALRYYEEKGLIASVGRRGLRRLFDAGVFTNPVAPPAVPASQCRLRTSLMATHTFEQVDFALEQFARIGRDLGVI